jgi:hypothetical protein
VEACVAGTHAGRYINDDALRYPPFREAIMKLRYLTLFVFTVLLAGCYHATIDTGRQPSPETVEKKWASGWVYGLVPPKTISTAAKCSDGVAKVETQLSFLNQVVGLLTLGIYTPMEIRATCAVK